MRDSFEDKSKRHLKTTPRQPKKVLARNIAILALSVVFLFTGIGMVYAETLLGRINTVVDESTGGDNPFQQTSADPDSASSAGEEGTESGSSMTLPDSEGLKKVGGLWHDDMIANILVMGVDDYQPNDPGRTDSMMLVTIDTRHEQLKVTSFMRDMYVAIPGYSSNRLNTAYSLEGPALLVSTIEANFGIDIDRWVVVDFSAFNEIIDAMGGVEITLTQDEANLVNQYSGDPRWNLSEGTYTLSGAQARYYSRIRAIGDDFERTQRQRNVFASIVNKFKSSDIGTINNVLYNTLNLIQTNMSRNYILSLAGQSLTYLNYDMHELRIPGDGQYESTYVNIGGYRAAVLVPDREACSESLVQFVFGDADEYEAAQNAD